MAAVKMAEALLPTQQRRRKTSSCSPDTRQDAVQETRIEISWGNHTEKEETDGSCCEADDVRFSGKKRIVDSAADIPHEYHPKQAPETIRVRDLNMDDVQIFTPVTAPLTQNTEPLTSDSTERKSGQEEDDFIPLAGLYESEGCLQATDCGCEMLDPKEILCGRRLIGHGASSQVYRGMYGDREVVLKFIVGSKEDSFEKEFRRECAVFQKIPPHENIIQMYGVVGTCLVLEYCNLGSLFDLIYNPDYWMPLLKVKEMLCDVASSLLHLHSRRIIHRDLKPGNLLVSRTEERDVVKLADFGLARNYLKNATMTVGIGTWQYSSPEFFTNSKLTAKSDVYSFGVVMWEMCTRRQPYHNTHFREIYECILKERDYRLPVPDEMDSCLASLYSRCTASNPNERPSFSQILSQLQCND